MFNIFKKDKKEEIIAPLSGEIIDIADVPDQVFASKMLGDGLAIIPNNDIVVAPCTAELIQVFAAKHAMVLKTSNGLEILIHIGIDSVELEGRGFEVFVKEGDQVKKGDKLLKIDLEYIRENAKSIITPIVLADMSQVENIKKEGGTVRAGEDLFMRVELS